MKNEGNGYEKSTQFVIFKKRSLVDTAWKVRNVNSCIQPHAENIWKTPKEVAEHNAKANIPNSAGILGPQGNATTIDASEYISKAQFGSKPHLRPRNQVQLQELQINNKLSSPNKIWLTTAIYPC